MYHSFFIHSSADGQFDAVHLSANGQGSQGWCTVMTQRDGMGRGGRWEGGSGWGTHVHPWLIHVNVWENHYNIVK